MAPVLLREAPIQPRYFWRDTLEEQFRQIIQDRVIHSTRKPLPPNEVLVLALNEVCCQYRRGRFLHLSTQPAAYDGIANATEIHPQERLSQQLWISMPNAVFMDFLWNEDDVNAFEKESQRGRWLRSSFVINPPPAAMPLFAIQVVTGPRDTYYATDETSIIVFAVDAPPAVRSIVCSSLILKEIWGHTEGERTALRKIPWLWDPSKIEGKSRREAAWNDQVACHLRQWECTTLVGIYNRLLEVCIGRDDARLNASFTSQELDDRLPRPDATRASSIGSSLGERISAEPRSRRGYAKNRPERQDTFV